MVCNAQTGLCYNPAADACNNSCVAPMVCNAQKGVCEMPQVDACNNACIAPQVCNAQKGVCEMPSSDCNPACTGTDVCSNGTCVPATSDPCDACAAAGKKCNDAKVCVECLANTDCVAKANGVCKQGACSYSETPDKPSACTGGCPSGQACNEANGKCVMIEGCGVEYDTCKSASDCELSTIGYENARTCAGGYCVWNACIDKTWDGKKQRCGNMSGEITACEEEVGACEEDPENVVLNWSFEDWTGSMPDRWKLYENTSVQCSPEISSSKEPQSCEKAVNFDNNCDVIARLEGDPILVPENPISGANIHFTCTVYAKGTGKLNLGYRLLDEAGEKVKDSSKTKDTEATKEITGLSSTYEMYDFDISIDETLAHSFQPLIGVKNGTVVVDSFQCVQTVHEFCQDIVCENSWEICDVKNHKDEQGNFTGACIPREGFCSVTKDKPEQGTCDATQICDTATHTCKRVDGKCLSNKDCTDDSKPVCSASNECVAGDPCEKVDCKVDWRECTLASRGTCVVKAGRCFDSANCTKDKPACYGKTHTCVDSDYAIDVNNAKECKTVDSDYFEYFNYDENDKQIYDKLKCPINIIPNGSFEEWVDFQFTEKSDVHSIPDWWYAMDGYHNFTAAPNRYLSELSFDSIKKYTTSVYHGDAALQLIHTTKGDKNRLTSWGFRVPDGTWDCSYWVRGTGDVRVHTYSNRGDAKATDFVHYDTKEWTRGTFELKAPASDARIIIYVGSTRADNDHIQVDNFVCTAKGSVVE